MSDYRSSKQAYQKDHSQTKNLRTHGIEIGQPVQSVEIQIFASIRELSFRDLVSKTVLDRGVG